VVPAILLVVAVLSSASEVTGELRREDGSRIHYGVAGRGVPVLLIHGGLVDSQMWDDQTEMRSLMPVLSRDP